MKREIYFFIMVLAIFLSSCSTDTPLYKYKVTNDYHGSTFDIKQLDYINNNSYIETDNESITKLNEISFKRINTDKANKLRKIIDEFIQEFYQPRYVNDLNEEFIKNCFDQQLVQTLKEKRILEDRNNIVNNYKITTIIEYATLVPSDYAKEYFDDSTDIKYYQVYASLIIAINAENNFFSDYKNVGQGNDTVELWICLKETLNGDIKIAQWAELIKPSKRDLEYTFTNFN